MAAWDVAVPGGATCLVRAGRGWVDGGVLGTCPVGEVGEQVSSISLVTESGAQTE